jgi:Protein of unknown function (DUF3309)
VNLHNCFGGTKAGDIANAVRSSGLQYALTQRACLQSRRGAPHREGESMLLIILIVLLLVFGFGGYSLGPGLGYYGGGGISLILLIVIVLLLLRVI